MTDVLTREQRSYNMSRIRGKNTKPELVVRRGIHRLGFRFRLHVKNLPGKPDLVLPKHHAVIFVHGCFWHGHDCPFFRWPKSRPEFWRAKIGANIERDRAARTALKAVDWRVLTVWECAFRGKSPEQGEAALDGAAAWLSGSSGEAEIRGNDSGAG